MLRQLLLGLVLLVAKYETAAVNVRSVTVVSTLVGRHSKSIHMPLYAFINSRTRLTPV